MRAARHKLGILTALAVSAFFACAGPDIAAPTPPAVVSQRGISTPGTNLIECPTNENQTATAVVTPLGGTLSVGGTSVVIPAGALVSTANVTVTIPASNILEIDVSVDGLPHFIFASPITVTVSYARCNRSNIDHSPLTVWYIDSETKALIEPMGGIDNKLLQTVTFTTGHLSGYAVAN
jgi:hypothetical protein